MSFKPLTTFGMAVTLYEDEEKTELGSKMYLLHLPAYGTDESLTFSKVIENDFSI